MLNWWRDELPPAVVKDPLGEHNYLNGTKARTALLSPLSGSRLDSTTLPYTRYHEIAALMLPEEIHPEVVEKLDAICRRVRCRAMSRRAGGRLQFSTRALWSPSPTGGSWISTAPDEA